MELNDLLELLEIPLEVMDRMVQYGKERKISVDSKRKGLLLNRSTCNEGLEQLKELVGEDPDGLKILWEMLNIACEVYLKYEKYGIHKQIYVDTMKFCTRFLHEYYQVNHTYKFVWSWWFTRQLSFQEFRVGCLEYELIEEKDKYISIHIPSDADLSAVEVDKSFGDFRQFLIDYFPDWVDAKWFCESWMMSPELKKLIDDKSNILAFQNRFDIVSINYDSLGVLDWVYPGFKSVSDDLPEKTRLQKNMKKFLLSGNKVGWAKGFIKSL